VTSVGADDQSRGEEPFAPALQYAHAADAITVANERCDLASVPEFGPRGDRRLLQQSIQPLAPRTILGPTFGQLNVED
jgi:hypothetical protein